MSSRSRARWALLIMFASLGQKLGLADGSELQPGVEMPMLEGKTLSGDLVSLPRDARGHAAILVIGFSKAAAKIGRPWLDNCRSSAASRSAGTSVYCYDVRMLEEVPRAFRSMVERGMRSNLPVELQRQTLLIYSENGAWRERVGMSDDKTVYVMGCDTQGRIQGTVTGPFVEMELQKLLDAIEPTPPSRD